MAVTASGRRHARIRRWMAVPLMAAAFALTQMPQWRSVEAVGFDLMSTLNPPSPTESPVVIVAIDEPSFAEVGLRWPWPRRLHARLLDALTAAGAAVVAFDIVFAEPSTPADDTAFAEAVARAGPVVLAGITTVIRQPQASLRMRVEPLPLFGAAGAATGLSDVDIDPDGVQRRLPTDPESLARVALAARGTPFAAPPTDGFVRYAGPPQSFPRVSYYQALDPGRHLPAGRLAGRIILVGLDLRVATEPDRQQIDKVATPFTRTTGQLSSGVEVHANIAETLRQGRTVTVVPLAAQAGVFLTLALAFVGVGRSWRPLLGLVQAAAAVVLVCGLAMALFTFADLWLPPLAPLVGIGLVYLGTGSLALAEERARRRFIRAAFGHYVADTVVDYILANPERLMLGGERRTVSVLFTDLAGFTQLSESLDAQALVRCLREYFEGMSDIVLGFAGTIDRFAGDAMMVLFNAPIDQPDHARRAVDCARALDAFGRDFAARQRAADIAWGDTRIGVHTGEAAVGNFGGRRRFAYTAIGDTVNTAARLETANKAFGTRVIVSAETIAACDGQTFSALRPIADVVVSGKNEAVTLYEVLPEAADDDAAVAAYREAYARMARGDADAAAAMAAVVQARAGDRLAAFHLTRLQAGEAGASVVLAQK